MRPALLKRPLRMGAVLCVMATMCFVGPAIASTVPSGTLTWGSSLAPWQASNEHAKPKKPKKEKAAKPPKVTPSGSEESRAERDLRLQRECKGRPNAGACLGYAS
jgi:hypothetical protein